MPIMHLLTCSRSRCSSYHAGCALRKSALFASLSQLPPQYTACSICMCCQYVALSVSQINLSTSWHKLLPARPGKGLARNIGLAPAQAALLHAPSKVNARMYQCVALASQRCSFVACNLLPPRFSLVPALRMHLREAQHMRDSSRDQKNWLTWWKLCFMRLPMCV